jgi:hypothetical protein
MISAFAPALHILPQSQRSLWPSLTPLAQLGFVLYGGTAIALRLGHRISVDFDFFSDQPLDRRKLQTVPFVKNSKIIIEEPESLTFLVELSGTDSGSVKLSLFGGIQFGRVGEPGWSTDGVIRAASLLDLLGTKLKVILKRAEAKDYLDIARILESGLPLARGLGAAQTLFGATFQSAECLKALSFFGAGDLATLGTAPRESLLSAATATRQVETVPLLARILT